jgi:hypothetical protein
MIGVKTPIKVTVKKTSGASGLQTSSQNDVGVYS